LTRDRRARAAHLDPEVVRAQKKLGKLVIWFAVATYPVGGFLLLGSVARRGKLASDAMLQLSRWWELPVVGEFHQADVERAAWWEKRVLGVVAVFMAAGVAVVAWALIAGV
jgi:hypothetical protein